METQFKKFAGAATVWAGIGIARSGTCAANPTDEEFLAEWRRTIELVEESESLGEF